MIELNGIRYNGTVEIHGAEIMVLFDEEMPLKLGENIELKTFSEANDVDTVFTHRIVKKIDGDCATIALETVPAPTQLDRIAAQALYTALMTDTLIEEGSDDV